MAENQSPKSTLSKIGHFYSQFAILILNTILLFLVVVFLLQVFLNYRDNHRAVSDIYSQYFDLESYQIVDQETAITVGKEFDVMGEQESYEYYPWATFMERPFKGEFLNVEDHDTYNARRTISPIEKSDKQSELLIWAFGGSTMLGWGLPDSQTIPSHLQSILQERLPQYQVRVINHGHAYWFSSLEMSLFSALLRTEEQPDIVIFLDGLNDTSRISSGMEVPFFAYHAYYGWESEREKRYYANDMPWVTINSSFPVYRLMNLSQTEVDEPDPIQKNSFYFNPPEDPAQRIIDVYKMNRDMEAAIANQFDIDAYFFWQPVPWYGEYEYNKQTMKTPAGGIEAYDIMIEDHYPNFFSIHDILWGTSRSYVDHSHYADWASREVALAIADSIFP